jgi:hypothetical protein
MCFDDIIGFCTEDGELIPAESMGLTVSEGLPKPAKCVKLKIPIEEPPAGFESRLDPPRTTSGGVMMGSRYKLPPEAQASLDSITQRQRELQTPDTLRTDLARVFGLAADAPDEVLLATARKAWSGISDAARGEHKYGMLMREQRDACMKDRGILADKCGDLEHENKRLRALLGDRLVGEKIGR